MFEFLKNIFTENNSLPSPLLDGGIGQVSFIESDPQEVFNLFFFDPNKVFEEGYEFVIQLPSEEACHEYAKWVEKESYRIERFDKANSKIVFET